jgi:hypothetical protein
MFVLQLRRLLHDLFWLILTNAVRKLGRSQHDQLDQLDRCGECNHRKLFGRSKLITWVISATSIPRAATSVATKTLTWLSLNFLRALFLAGWFLSP